MMIDRLRFVGKHHLNRLPFYLQHFFSKYHKIKHLFLCIEILHLGFALMEAL